MNKSKQDDEEAKTITQRFLFGYDVMKPVPLVIGISATPERFERLLERRRDRHVYVEEVDPVKVRESGLLKDFITVRVPDDDQPSDWSLLRAAAERWKSMRDAWRDYCQAQGIPVIEPIMVIQVEDGSGGRVSNTDLDLVISTLEEAVGPISNEQLAHCFDDDREVVTKSHRIRYIAPSNVSSDSSVRFLFFKMALTTGWDCPRAEVMMSFRKAVDATLIAQLVGRMVRTPLARRIEDNEVLNEVHLYLPHYDSKGLNAIIEKLKGDVDIIPAVDVRMGRDITELSVPEHFEPIRQLLNSLPTYVIQSGQKQPDFKRVLALANLLTVRHGLDQEALDMVTARLVETFAHMRDKISATDPDFKAQVSGLGKITIRPLVIDYLTDRITEGAVETIEVSDRNVEDLYRLAKQRIGDHLAIAYLKANYDEDNPYKAKLELYLLLQRPDVLAALNATAQGLISSLKAKHQAAINAMESSKRVLYDEIWARGRTPEQVSLRLPRQVTFPRSKSDRSYEKHLYVDSSGEFKTDLNGWEIPVIEAEISNCVAWLRNLPQKPWSLAYPYHMNGIHPGFPDFIVVRSAGNGFVVDILEPHSHALADAWAKARGLAEFADKHGSLFGRIEMQLVRDGRIIRLDFQNLAVRDRALRLNGPADLDNLFLDLGT